MGIAIDTSSITGYADMTPEEKVAALEAFQFETPDAKNESETVSKLKNALSKANKEAHTLKDQLREKMSEAERLEAERAESEQAIREELEHYREKDRISTYTAKLMDAGYDGETAKTMAGGLPAGVPDTFFESQKQFLADQRKAIENAVINKQLDLTPGKTPKSKDIEDATTAMLRQAAGLR